MAFLFISTSILSYQNPSDEPTFSQDEFKFAEDANTWVPSSQQFTESSTSNIFGDFSFASPGEGSVDGALVIAFLFGSLGLDISDDQGYFLWFTTSLILP